MNNDIVKSREFEKSKQKLRNFSTRIPSTSYITPVSEKTLFGILNSNVTGEDLNNVVKIFQKRSIDTNNYLKNIIKEFETIYNTFESLDKDYIQSIIVAVKSAEESSKQADKNYKIIDSLINKLQDKFENSESLYEEIKSDVKIITDASVKLNNIKNLENIDVTYIQASENKTTLKDLRNNFINLRTDLEKNIDETTQGLDKIRVQQKDLKSDIIERINVNNEYSLKKNKEFTGKMNRDLDEIRIQQKNLKSDIIERIKVNNENYLKKNKEFASKMDRDLDKIRVQQRYFKSDIIERINVNIEDSLKKNKELTYKMNQDLDEIRIQQEDLKLEIFEKLKVSNENTLKRNKIYSNKLFFVALISVIALILSITMLVINLMNNVS